MGWTDVQRRYALALWPRRMLSPVIPVITMVIPAITMVILAITMR